MTEEPRLWLIRARNGEWTDDFVENGYVGIGYNLDGVDMSNVKTLDEVREIYAKENTGNTNEQSNRNRSSQIAAFHLDVKKDDFVVTPGVGGKIVRYGRFSSDDTYYVDDADGLPCRNRRRVDWAPRILSGDDLPPTILTIQGTVRQIRNDANKAAFLELIKGYRPEDSWVPFHLEVGKKLVEGEWWLEDKREDLVDLIQRLREADPEGTTESNETYDPFNFYQAFCQRQSGQDRTECFEILRNELALDTELPDGSTKVWSINSDYRVRESLDFDQLDAFWKMLRAAFSTDPAKDDSCRKEFIDAYNRVHSTYAVRPNRWARILSTWLYLIDPRKFVYTHRFEQLGLLDDLGLDYWASGTDGDYGAGYVRALARAKELATQAGLTLLDVNRESTTREMLGLGPFIGPGEDTYDVEAMLDEGVFLERSGLERMLTILRSKRNLILQGPPGVGKTFIARKLAYVLMGSKTENRITSVQFHQSYSYEDFVGGFRPDVEDGQMVFTRQDGPFLEMCAAAQANPDDAYVMLIDEINRGNLSRVFGELLMLIEADKRKPEFAVKLQHRPDDDEGFFVPENVYIIGTMNLADRSLTGMNVAMRRRFGFVDLKPQFKQSVFANWLARETDMPPEWREWINSKMFDLNQTIAKHPSLNENYAVGHSFFCPRERTPEEGWNEWYETVVEYEIRPLLREYWFDDPDTANDEANKLLRNG